MSSSLRFRDVSYLCDIATGQEAKKAMTGRSSSAESHWEQSASCATVPRAPVSATVQVFGCVTSERGGSHTYPPVLPHS